MLEKFLKTSPWDCLEIVTTLRSTLSKLVYTYFGELCKLQPDRHMHLPLKDVCISIASSKGSTLKQYNMPIRRVKVTLSRVPSASVAGHFFKYPINCRVSLLDNVDWHAAQNRHSARSWRWSVMKSISCLLWRSSPMAWPFWSFSSSSCILRCSSCLSIVFIKPN